MPRPANQSRDAVYIDDAECTKETDKAVLVEAPGFDGPEWIPKSCLHDDSEIYSEGDTGTLAVTKWFAAKLGVA